MKKLIKQSKKKEAITRAFNFQKRIAMAIIIIMPAVIIKASTLQRVVFKFVINVYEKYTEIFFDKNNSSQPITDEKFTVLKPTYIPEGYKVIGKDGKIEEETYMVVKVKKGDTLWKISRKYLGKGTRFKEIMKLNNLKKTTIHVGQKLKVPVK